jgi:hypothetical protein
MSHKSKKNYELKKLKRTRLKKQLLSLLRRGLSQSGEALLLSQGKSLN